jgi:phosphoribosyl-AMP cyclohydrolase
VWKDAKPSLQPIDSALTSFPAPGTTAELERGCALTPRFDANGLIAAVATHAETGEVLMLAWMNAEALARTVETREAHYWSRSRQTLWKKGATSGQIQTVEEIRIDCDQDAVWLKVTPQGDGGACHVGFRSCFYRMVGPDGSLVESP